MLSAAVDEFRNALRGLRNSPGLMALAVASLALGVGANIAVFRIVAAVLLPPQPGERIESLAAVYHRDAQSGRLLSISYPDYLDYRRNSRSFADLAAFIRLPRKIEAADGLRGGVAEVVSGTYFDVLQSDVARGRTLSPGDDRAEAPPAAVVSDAFWRSRMGGDPAALGATIRISGRPFTVVGIAKPKFRGTVIDWLGEDPSVWIPAAKLNHAAPDIADRIDMLTARRAASFVVTGRLAPGTTHAQAEAELSVLSRLVDPNGSEVVPAVFPLAQARFWPGHRESVSVQLTVLGVVVGLILLIACFNLAALLMARFENRRRDLAVSAALGATRGRLVARQFLEALVLSSLAAALSVLCSEWITRYFLSYPKLFAVPMAIDAAWDWRSAFFVFVVSMAAALAFGLVPALRMRSVNLNDALKAGSLGGYGRSRWWDALVVGQVALSSVMLIGALLLTKTLSEAKSRARVENPEQVLSASLDLGDRSISNEERSRLPERLRAALAAEPQVVAVGASSSPPLAGGVANRPVMTESGDTIRMHDVAVTPGYFAALGYAMLQGRDFTSSDGADSAPAAIVNREAARRLGLAGPSGVVRFGPKGEAVRIIGLVDDGDIERRAADPAPVVYRPAAQSPRRRMTFQLRFLGSPSEASRLLESHASSHGPPVEIGVLQPLTSLFDSALSQERLAARLLGGLSVLALLLTGLGVYGVVSFSVARRKRDIAIRKAVGAPAAAVVRDALWSGMRLAVVGAGVALAVAAAAAPAVEAALFGVQPRDPWILGSGAAALIVAAVLAAAPAAWRAARIDPLAGLRQE